MRSVGSLREFDLQCEICKEEGIGTYRVPARCWNCSAEGEAVLSKGHEFLSETCPRCHGAGYSDLRLYRRVRRFMCSYCNGTGLRPPTPEEQG